MLKKRIAYNFWQRKTENESKTTHDHLQGGNLLDVVTKLIRLVFKTLGREEVGHLGSMGQDGTDGIGVVLGVAKEFHTRRAIGLDILAEGLGDQLGTVVAGQLRDWEMGRVAGAATLSPVGEILVGGSDVLFGGHDV